MRKWKGSSERKEGIRRGREEGVGDKHGEVKKGRLGMRGGENKGWVDKGLV